MTKGKCVIYYEEEGKEHRKVFFSQVLASTWAKEPKDDSFKIKAVVILPQTPVQDRKN